MLTAAGIVVVTIWAAGLSTLVLNLLTLRGSSSETTPDSLPSLSVVVPARDEERDIGSAARSLVSQDYPDLEVIIVDDQSTDRTGEILTELAREFPRLQVVRGQTPPPGWLGKPWALQQGGLRARNDLLLFCDADVHYGPEGLRKVVGAFLAEEVDGLTVLPKIEMRGLWEHVLMVQLPLSALTAIPLFLARSVRSPLLAVGGGPGNLVRRSTWETIGTHERLKQAVVDDVALMQLVRHEGGRTGIVLASDLVSVRMYRGLGEIIRGFSKNAFHAMGGTLPRSFVAFTLMFLSQLLPLVIGVHALLIRLTGGRLETGHWLGLIALALLLVSRVVLFLRFRYGMLNALLGHPLMAVGWLVILLRSIWRVGIRRQLVWRGRGYDARSARFGK